MKRILLLAALPQEYARLLRTTGPWRRLAKKPFRVFSRDVGEGTWFLVETGMGQERFEEALRWSSHSLRPDCILKFGFVGSLTAALPVGCVVLGDSFFAYDDSGKTLSGGIQVHIGRELSGFCSVNGVTVARFVTTGRPLPKGPLLAKFADRPTVLDMESAAAARHAASEGIPFLCLGAVSDAAEHEIGFDLDAIMDSRGAVDIRKVLAAVVRDPKLIGTFYRNWKRSSLAGRNMGDVLRDFLALHAPVHGDSRAAERLWRTGEEDGGA